MNVRLLASLAALALAAPAVFAYEDDAHSYALEAAGDAVSKGVELRQDYARGTLSPGQKAKVKFQVFKGNTYWLFVGGSEEGVKMDVALTDAEGKAVEGEKKSAPQAVVFRFKAESTGMVTAEVSGKVSPPAAFDWAVVYGYRGGKGGKKE